MSHSSSPSSSSSSSSSSTSRGVVRSTVPRAVRSSVSVSTVRGVFSVARLCVGVLSYVAPYAARYVFGIATDNDTYDLQAHRPLLSLSKLFAIREIMLGLGILHTNHAVRHAAVQANIICDAVDVCSYLTAVSVAHFMPTMKGIYSHGATFTLQGDLLFGVGALLFTATGLWIKAHAQQDKEEQEEKELHDHKQ